MQYRVGKTHCQGHQDPSKRVSIFLGTPEANLKMVPINSIPIPRRRTYSTKPENKQCRASTHEAACPHAHEPARPCSRVTRGLEIDSGPSMCGRDGDFVSRYSSEHILENTIYDIMLLRSRDFFAPPSLAVANTSRGNSV